MAKIPYMPFDVLAWFSSGTVSAMTNAEEGIYVRLLLHAWNHPECTLPNDISEIRRLAKNAPLKTVQKILDKCFKSTTHGYRNEKSYGVWKNVIAHSKIASEKAKRMHNIRKTKELDNAVAHAGAHAVHDAESLLNSCNQKQNQNKDFKSFCEDSIELHLAKGLLLEILKWKPNFKNPNLQSWAKDFDLLLRVDGRNSESVSKVIIWCQRDSFWRSNILSASKLRKQFDQLEAKMKGRNNDSRKSLSQRNEEENARSREATRAYFGVPGRSVGLGSPANESDLDGRPENRCYDEAGNLLPRETS